MEKIIRVTCLMCLMVMVSVVSTSCLSFTLGVGNELSGNVAKSKVQKDKSVIAELRQAICVAMADEKYIEAESNENGVDVAGDGKAGKVVLQVLSPEYTYYLDENGEHEGEY